MSPEHKTGHRRIQKLILRRLEISNLQSLISKSKIIIEAVLHFVYEQHLQSCPFC